MPQVSFRSDGRTPGVDRSGVLTFTWAEFLSAAISVGRLWDPYRRTGSPPVADASFLLFDAFHRAGAIAAYLAEQGHRVVKSALYDQLDRSEKMIASYFTGMAIAKVSASHELSVHQLVHIDRFSHPAIRVPPTGPRPDLIAWDRNNARWVVVEAKGRSSGRAADPLAKMRAQKGTVLLRGAPAVRVGTLSYYRQPGTPLVADDSLHLEVVDPPEQIELSLDADQVTWSYYRPLVELITTAERSAEVEVPHVQAVSIPTADADFGVATALVELVGEEPTEGLAGAIAVALRDLMAPGNAALLPDGTWVQLGESWPRQRARQTPPREF